MKKAISLLLIGLAALIPWILAIRAGVPEGGLIADWFCRADELSIALGNGRFLLFPTEETILNGGSLLRAMDSDFWYLLPALCLRSGMSVLWAWRSCMILVQIGTLITSILFFRRLFGRTESDDPAMENIMAAFGVLLYMTCPYRLFVCFELADMGQAVFGALLPLYLWALLGIAGREELLVDLPAACLALAGMAYANLLLALTAAGFTILAALFGRKWLCLIPSAGGAALALPCLLRLSSYLFGSAFDGLGIPLDSIMGKGYVPGEFFAVFAYLEGHPGLGAGLLTGLILALWIRVAEEKDSDIPGGCRYFVLPALTLAVMALQIFPWEFAQRLGIWSLKLVALFGTPAVFWGMAQIGFCVPAAWALGQMTGRLIKR